DQLAVSVRQGGARARARRDPLRAGGCPAASLAPARGRGPDRAAARAGAGDRRRGDLRFAQDRRAPGVQARSARIVAALTGLATPRSVTIALTSGAGVTSDA